jgi:hypothetical protein
MKDIQSPVGSSVKRCDLVCNDGAGRCDKLRAAYRHTSSPGRHTLLLMWIYYFQFLKNSEIREINLTNETLYIQ